MVETTLLKSLHVKQSRERAMAEWSHMIWKRYIV